ncbi:MAG: hypothetical protein V4667_03740 [Bacteroidota bacterium]
MRAEPRTILRFLLQYFNAIVQLFETQRAEGIIKSEKLDAICKEADSDIKSQLIEYKILKLTNGDYELRKSYEDFLSFILTDFKLDLPESIQKYYYSINELFAVTKTTPEKETVILSNRLEGLYDQIKEFVELVESNTVRLLSETRALKANVEKIDYTEKVQKASFWIDYYIVPLNKILDVNHPMSIANKLYEIGNFTNERRLNFHEEKIRLQFEKLYSFLLQTNDDLLRQSKILTNELLPLIERIKTESLILTGFIEFLRNPDAVMTPPMLLNKRFNPFSKNILLNTIEYFEQFLNQEKFYLDENDVEQDKWIFNRERFRAKLIDRLPVPNFFEWCTETLTEEFKEIETEKFFAMASLLFEDEVEIVAPDKDDVKLKIRTDKLKLEVPKLKIIRKDGVSKVS